MSLYTMSGDQMWGQSPIGPTQPVDNQYEIPGTEDGQEDLVARFARQMNMATPTPSGASLHVSPPILYSITQHYHHSSHVARCETPDGAPKAHFMPTETTSLDGILISNNVNPLSLSSMQRRLFEYAMPDQRSRLLQMWQICPANSTPSPAEAVEGGHASGLATRLTRTTSNQTVQPPHFYDVEMYDQSQGGTSDDGQHYAEPYMVSGYEDLAQKDRELSAHAIMPVTIEPTTGAPYKIANDPVYGIGGSTVV